jgi:hypothetical protein
MQKPNSWQMCGMQLTIAKQVLNELKNVGYYSRLVFFTNLGEDYKDD